MVNVKQLQDILKKKKIDLFLAVNLDFSRLEYNMAYFSGYGSVGILVVPKSKKPFLVVSGMEKERAEKSGFAVYCPPKGIRLSEYTKKILKKKGIKAKRIGIDKEEFSLALKDVFYKAFKGRFVDLRKDLHKIREIKTEEEIRVIREGCKISDKILGECFRVFHRFKTEMDVKNFLEIQALKCGAEIAFPTIVASGKNARMAHYDSCDSKLMDGFCIIDYGIRYKNYCTDTTRTIYIGKPSLKDMEIYEMLLTVQNNAIQRAKLGARCSAIYDSVVKDLGKYHKYFTHGLGHGFGIKVHELPNLTLKSKDRIKDGAVFTVEPGVYLGNLGIRIEDDLLVWGSKVEVLTKVKKELVVIKR